jgi:flagellar basal body-associated protein FliL
VLTVMILLLTVVIVLVAVMIILAVMILGFATLQHCNTTQHKTDETGYECTPFNIYTRRYSCLAVMIIVLACSHGNSTVLHSY